MFSCSRFVALMLLCLLMGGVAAFAQQVEFGYDGRVRSGGVAFNGTGQFKFAIINDTGTHCYWSNDGATLTDDEPTSSVRIGVANGFFSTIIGDAKVENMAPLDASIFNMDERVCLRVWFNDGVNGFQQLTPDRPIANPALIGLQTGQDMTIYVNPVTGDDANGGTRSDQAKKNIQAAWDALPELIRHNATIKLADGVYYTTATLTGKVCAGGTIKVEGNVTSPTRVQMMPLKSDDPDSEYSSILVRSQKNLIISGIQFYGRHDPIFVTEESSVAINNCEFEKNFASIFVSHSTVNVDSCYFHDSQAGMCYGIQAPQFSYVSVTNSHFDNCCIGITIGRNTLVSCGGSLFENLVGRGIEADGNCTIVMELPTTTFSNVSTGLKAEYCSNITYSTSRASYVNVQTPVSVAYGSYSKP